MSCDYENLCLELIDGSWIGVIFEIFVFIYSFVGIAEVADAYLAVGLETLCERWVRGPASRHPIHPCRAHTCPPCVC